MAKKSSTSRRKRNRIVVIGLGRFGTRLARELYTQGHEVLALDRDADLVDDIKGSVSYAVAGDSTNEQVLQELGVDEYDVAVVAIGKAEKENIMTTVLLKSEMRSDSLVVARARNELHANTLRRLGCERVILLEDEMGIRVAETLFRLSTEHIDIQPQLSAHLINIPRSLVGKRVAEAGLKIAHTLKDTPKDDEPVLLLIKRGQKVVWGVDSDTELESDDRLLICGSDETVNALQDS